VRLRPEEVTVLLPDLVVEVDNTAVQTEPQTLAVSGSITAQVNNAGTAPTSAQTTLLAFYDIDLNGVYDNEADITLGQAVLEKALAVAESATIEIALAGELPFRDASINVWVDNAQTVVESDEKNNVVKVCLGCENGTNTGPTHNEEKYYGYNTLNGYLTLVGFTNKTVFTLRPLPSGTVISGTINQLERSVLYLSSIRHFVLETSAPLLAVLHSRCCSTYTSTGSFFYPTVDGKSFYGTSFILTAIGLPGRGTLNYGHLVVFAQEEAVVTVRNVAGEIIATSPMLTKGNSWRLDKLPYYKNRSYILRHGEVYTVSSTGRIAIINTERNGYTQIPPVPDSQKPNESLDDVGKLFYFPLLTWTGSGIAVFNPLPEPAVFSVTNLKTGATVITEQSVAPNNIHYTDFPSQSGLGYYELRVLQGQLTVWAGGTEGGHTVADLGDDYSTSFGWEGKQFVTHTQTNGAYLFVGEDETNIIINGGKSQLLNADDLMTLPRRTQVTITADKPVSLQTIGGTCCYRSNDYATSLRPALQDNIQPSADMSASLLRLIDNGIGQPVTLQVRIGNAGAFASSEGLLLTFYAGDPVLGGTELGTVTLESLAPGTYQDIQLEGVELLDFNQEIYAVVDASNMLEECNETNNRVSTSISASTANFLGELNLTTDAPEYGPNAPVAIDYTIANQGALAADFQVELRLEDTRGKVLETFSAPALDTLAGGESLSLNARWNTGTTLAGPYQVHALLYKNTGELVTEDDTAFVITAADGPRLSLRSTTDKPSYHTTDVVLINNLLNNLSLNVLVDDALLTLTITGPNGQPLHSQSQAIEPLSPKALQDVLTPYMLKQAPKGTYTVTVSLEGRDSTLASQQTSFTVENDLNLSVVGQVQLGSAPRLSHYKASPANTFSR
jgi:hypothetical protein